MSPYCHPIMTASCRWQTVMLKLNRTRSFAIAEGPRDALSLSVEILSTDAKIYEKFHLKRMQSGIT